MKEKKLSKIVHYVGVWKDRLQNKDCIITIGFTLTISDESL